MGESWKAEHQANLEEWQTHQGEAPSPAPEATIPESFNLRDVLRGVAAYYFADLRHRIFRADLPTWSLADHVEFAQFCRELREPCDPELEALLEEDLDIFEGVDCYHA